MRDYYVIQRLFESPSTVGLSTGSRMPTVARRDETVEDRGIGGSRLAGTEIFADDVVVDFPSVQQAVARIRASVGMWDLEGLWASDCPLNPTDVVE